MNVINRSAIAPVCAAALSKSQLIRAQNSLMLSGNQPEFALSGHRVSQISSQVE